MCFRSKSYYGEIFSILVVLYVRNIKKSSLTVNQVFLGWLVSFFFSPLCFPMFQNSKLSLILLQDMFLFL